MTNRSVMSNIIVPHDLALSLNAALSKMDLLPEEISEIRIRMQRFDLGQRTERTTTTATIVCVGQANPIKFYEETTLPQGMASRASLDRNAFDPLRNPDDSANYE